MSYEAKEQCCIPFWSRWDEARRDEMRDTSAEQPSEGPCVS